MASRTVLRKLTTSTRFSISARWRRNNTAGRCFHLELTERGVRPRRSLRSAHQELDELKRLLALAVVRQFTPREIRAQSLANLHRWKKQGSWVSAYDEW